MYDMENLHSSKFWCRVVSCRVFGGGLGRGSLNSPSLRAMMNLEVRDESHFKSLH